MIKIFIPHFEDSEEEAEHITKTVYNGTIRHITRCTDENDNLDLDEAIEEIKGDWELIQRIIEEETRRNISILNLEQTGRANYKDALEDSSNPNEDYKDIYSLKESRFFSTHFQFANRKSDIYEIEGNDEDPPEIIESENARKFTKLNVFQNEESYFHAYSIWGNPVELTGDPKPREVYLEDEGTLTVIYWMTGKPNYTFNHEKMAYEKIKTLGRAICRVHLDEGFMELQSRNIKKEDESEVITELEHVFENSIELERKEIDRGEIEDRTEDLEKITSEKRQGEDTNVYVSGSDTDADISGNRVRQFVIDLMQDRVNAKMEIPRLGNEEHGIKIYSSKDHFSCTSSKLLPKTRSEIIKALYGFCWSND